MRRRGCWGGCGRCERAVELWLDVSELEPCEPLERTLAALAGLGSGDYLRVLHRREPRLLFPLLERQGLRGARAL